MTCEVCPDPATRLGRFCGKHYRRFLRYGDPLAGQRSFRGAAKAHFDALIAAQDDADLCVIDWPYSTASGGYPVWQEEGKKVLGHQRACEVAHGPRPEGHVVRHLCGQPLCLRLTHLSWGTEKQNQADRVAHETDNRGERNPSAKLTMDQVEEVRQRCREGERQVDLAGAYGVSQSTISAIANGKRWPDKRA